DKFLGDVAGAFFPEGNELQDGIRVLLLTQLAVGVAKDARTGVLGQEGEEALLTAAALGNIVFFHERVLAGERDGMKIEIEGGAVLQPQLTHGVEPQAGQLGVTVGIDATTVLGQKGAFGDNVEASEEGQAFVQHELMTWLWRAEPNSF